MQHQPALRLPLTFDEDKLLYDLGICLDRSWSAHFNQMDYDGDWDSIALRSASGDPEDIRAHPGAQYCDTPLLQKCSYFCQVLQRFSCPLETVRLLRLAPGSVIKEHCDLGTSYLDGVLRIHIPVTTNPGVEFLVGGKQLIMLPGECWYADFSLPHRVRNYGETGRIHLVIDALRNDWTDAVFREAGYDFIEEENIRRPSQEMRDRMIEELSLQDTPAARDLIAKLRSEYA